MNIGSMSADAGALASVGMLDQALQTQSSLVAPLMQQGSNQQGNQYADMISQSMGLGNMLDMKV